MKAGRNRLREGKGEERGSDATTPTPFSPRPLHSHAANSFLALPAGACSQAINSLTLAFLLPFRD